MEFAGAEPAGADLGRRQGGPGSIETNRDWGAAMSRRRHERFVSESPGKFDLGRQGLRPRAFHVDSH